MPFPTRNFNSKIISSRGLKSRRFNQRNLKKITEDAIAYWDAGSLDQSSRFLQELIGSGVGPMRFGSSIAVNANDPTRLEFSGSKYIYCPGVAGANSVSAPDSSLVRVTGDIDIRVKVALDNWTPSATNSLMAKRDSDIGFHFRVLTSGFLDFTWSTTGEAGGTLSVQSTATGLSSGEVKWVRVTMDVDNGSNQRVVVFYKSDDGVSWTIINTVTTNGTTSIFSAPNSSLRLGNAVSNSQPLSGKIYYAELRSGIDGAIVARFDASFAVQTGYIDLLNSNNTVWTINRATSGKRPVLVERNVLLLGSDDYLECVDDKLLNFNTSDSFSICILVRQWSNVVSSGRYIAKKEAGAAAGWGIQATGGLGATSDVADGTNQTLANSGAITAGEISLLTLVRNVASDTLITYVNSTPGSSVTDNSTNLTSTNTLRVGRGAGSTAVYQDFEFFAALIFRKALSSEEINLMVQTLKN
jgi:hypothetical protein